MPSFPPGFGLSIGQYALLQRSPGPKDRTHVQFKVAGTQRANRRLIDDGINYSGALDGSGFNWDTTNGEIIVKNRRPTRKVRIQHRVVTVTYPGPVITYSAGAEEMNEHTYPATTIPPPGTSYSYRDTFVATVVP